LSIGAAGLLLAWSLAPRLALFATTSAEILRYPWVVDAAESVNLQSAHTLSLGRDPYRADPNGFVSTPYPPIYLALAAIWLRLGGVDLLGGRLISLFATLLVAGLIGLLVVRETGQRVAGLLAGCLFLACGPTIVWAAFYRQDFLALAFGLAGLAWVARWPGGRLVYGALPWLLLAVYTKQTALAAPLAACLYLLWDDWRRGLRFALALLGTLALPFALLDLLTRHGFWEQVVADHALWQRASFERHLRRLLVHHGALLVLAAPGFAVLLRRWRPSLLALYAPLACATIVGSGAVGANNNHLLEPLLALCLLVGVVVGGCAREWQRPRYAAALVVALLLIAWQMPRLGAVSEWYDASTLPSASRAERMARVAGLIAQAEGELLSDDAYLLLRAGKTAAYQNLPMLGALAEAGQWDDGGLVRDLAARRFALVVIAADLTDPEKNGGYWPPAAREALAQHYRLLYRDVLFTYVPRR
jgi:hypothetical protein